jgi:class 3 adenylate cyclase/tetratricopeptide (TPR) repeat protein
MTSRTVTAPATATGAVTVRPYVPRIVSRGGELPDVLVAEGTLVSADLSGFTKLSEKLASRGKQGAEELTELLNRCFTAMIAHVEAGGGDVLKFGGDALLILFSGPEHAARACRACVGMREVIRLPLETASGKVRLRISQGMHSGRFELLILRAGHTELVVTGEGATETVECEATAEAGQILLSSMTAAELDPHYLSPRPDGRALLVRTPPVSEMVDLTSGSYSGRGLERFVPTAQLEQIAVGAPSEHRWVSIAFLKFSHTDHLMAHEGAEALRRRLQHLATVADEVCPELGVHWLATDVAPDGGKFIFAAGAPTSAGDDEDHLLRAMRAIVDRVSGIELKIGVNCGHVFVGDLGAPTRRAFTIMGDAVNLTARLMQAAGTGDVLASRTILQRTRTPFQTVDVEPFHVKGKSALVHASRVLRIDSGASAAPRADLFPLIGRDREYALLNQACDAAVNGQGRFIELVGESGTGKTRLTDELLDRRHDLAVLRVECGQYARQTPYFASRNLLRSIAGVPPAASPVEAGEVLAAWVEATMPQQRSMLPLLAAVFDAEVPPTPEASEIAREFWRERTIGLIARLIATTVTAPTLFLVEDSHWLDDSSREILERLANDVERGPWALLTTRRPGPAPLEPTGLEHRIIIELLPLDPTAAIALGMVAGGDAARLPPGDWDTIAARSGGNPLFVIELAAAAVAGGSAESLTNSVESLITARIDALAPADRILLREAAVLGLVVDLDLYATATGDRSVRSPKRWERLAPFVIAEGRQRVRFRNVLYRDVAYEGLAYRRRREMHHRLAERLDQLAFPPASLCSLHFERAGDHDRAWAYAVQAGREASRSYANAEGAELFHRALRCAKSIPDLHRGEVATVAEELADVCGLVARFDDAKLALAQARQIRRGEPVRLARLMRKEGWIRERMAQYPQAVRWYRRALTLLGRSNEADVVAEVAALELGLSIVRHRVAQFRDAVSWGQQAIEHAEQAGELDIVANALLVVQAGLESLGEAGDRVLLERAVELYHQAGDLPGEARALLNLGVSAHLNGHWEEALGFYERSRVLAERCGDVVSAGLVELNVGELLSSQGRLIDAEIALSHATTNLRSARHRHGESYARMNLGVTLCRQSRHNEGEAHLAEATAAYVQVGSTAEWREARGLQVEALGRRRNWPAVVAQADALLSEVGSSDPGLSSRLHRFRAQALIEMGESDGVGDTLERALAMAESAAAEDLIALALVVKGRWLDELGEPIGAVLRDEGLARCTALGMVDPVGICLLGSSPEARV